MITTTTLEDLRSRVEEVTAEVIAPRADEVDRDAAWPVHSMRALAEAGVLGLHVPVELGGLGQGLRALAELTEVIGRACASSALCFGMHCVGTAVIAAKPTRDQENRYLRPIAQGKHLTTLALSEAGSGALLYLPETKLVAEGDDFLVFGTKHFVTNGGKADSYVVSTLAQGESEGPGEFNCLLVDEGTSGMEWLEPWSGIGMRGNSSRSVRLDGARVPKANLLGAEGDQVWYVFEVIAPYFIVAMSGAYLGIARSSLDLAIQHLKERSVSVTGEALADVETLQLKVAELWADVQKTRLLIHNAAELGDLGDPDAILSIFAAKAEVAETVTRVANEAMTLCGGIAYRSGGQLERNLRDARAAHVMSPTTNFVRTWLGRALMGRPLL
jgi:isovaleryl-CoA dehydrogenase